MNIESINQNIMTMRFSRDEFGVLRGCAADVTEPSLMENDYDIFECRWNQ